MLNRKVHPLLILFCLLFIMMPVVVSAQQSTQPVFRIGVIYDESEDVLNGSQLAVQQINDAGGIRGADGTQYRLEIIAQSDEDILTSLANLNQAAVIATIGPSSSLDVLANILPLQELGVPILTPAQDDSIITLDNTDRIYRVRAQEFVRGRALADYLVNQLNAQRIVTVQLDLESTGGIFGVTTALQSLNVPVAGSFLRDTNTPIEQLVNNIAASNPDAVVVYGDHVTTADLYQQIRALGWQGQFAYNQADAPEFRELLTVAPGVGIVGASTWSYTADDDETNAFVFDYITAFGKLPSPLSASGYDAITLISNALQQPGDIFSNLSSLSNISGVQGVLNPSGLPNGETSTNVTIFELGNFGAPATIVRYFNSQILDAEISPIASLPTPTPQATATPDGVTLTIDRAVQNVRNGPGLNYDVIGQLREGEQARVIGANLDFSWVVISFRGQNGWLSRSILDVFGDLNSVPIVQAPPTPTPLPATATPTSQPFPDIVITGATPNRITVGVPFNINVTVRNQGALPAGGFAVAGSLEPGGVYSGVNLNGLGANTDATITLTGVVNGTTGPQNIVIVADLNSQVDEGPLGEQNNTTFNFSYVADGLVMAGGSGTIFVNNNFGTSLDGGGTDDIFWSGGVLSGVGSTTFEVLNGFSSFDAVHRDGLPGTPTQASLTGTSLQPGTLIGFVTDGGAKKGVMQLVTAPSGGQLQFNVRVYD